MVKRLLSLLALLCLPAPMCAQMLFSENLTMSLDSTKTLQGTIMPVLNFQNEKEDVFTLKNTANINLLIRRSRVLNLINKLEFSTYGDKITVSGGVRAHGVSLPPRPSLRDLSLRRVAVGRESGDDLQVLHGATVPLSPHQ